MTSSHFGLAQNLVPNHSFEQYLSDPSYDADGVNESIGWFALSHTPDFFHANYHSNYSPGANWRGNQEAFNGSGYAGILASTASREYLSCLGPEDQIFNRTVQGKMIVQN